MPGENKDNFIIDNTPKENMQILEGSEDSKALMSKTLDEKGDLAQIDFYSPKSKEPKGLFQKSTSFTYFFYDQIKTEQVKIPKQQPKAEPEKIPVEEEINGDYRFAVGKTNLKKTDIEAIEELAKKSAKQLLNNADLEITIQGYASTTGSVAINKKLSEGRAAAVSKIFDKELDESLDKELALQNAPKEQWEQIKAQAKSRIIKSEEAHHEEYDKSTKVTTNLRENTKDNVEKKENRSVTITGKIKSKIDAPETEQKIEYETKTETRRISPNNVFHLSEEDAKENNSRKVNFELTAPAAAKQAGIAADAKKVTLELDQNITKPFESKIQLGADAEFSFRVKTAEKLEYKIDETDHSKLSIISGGRVLANVVRLDDNGNRAEWKHSGINGYVISPDNSGKYAAIPKNGFDREEEKQTVAVKTKDRIKYEGSPVSIDFDKNDNDLVIKGKKLHKADINITSASNDISVIETRTGSLLLKDNKTGKEKTVTFFDEDGEKVAAKKVSGVTLNNTAIARTEQPSYAEQRAAQDKIAAEKIAAEQTKPLNYLQGTLVVNKASNQEKPTVTPAKEQEAVATTTKHKEQHAETAPKKEEVKTTPTPAPVVAKAEKTTITETKTEEKPAPAADVANTTKQYVHLKDKNGKIIEKIEAEDACLIDVNKKKVAEISIPVIDDKESYRFDIVGDNGKIPVTLQRNGKNNDRFLNPEETDASGKESAIDKNRIYLNDYSDKDNPKTSIVLNYTNGISSENKKARIKDLDPNSNQITETPATAKNSTKPVEKDSKIDEKTGLVSGEEKSGKSRVGKFLNTIAKKTENFFEGELKNVLPPVVEDTRKQVKQAKDEVATTKNITAPVEKPHDKPLETKPKTEPKVVFEASKKEIKNSNNTGKPIEVNANESKTLVMDAGKPAQYHIKNVKDPASVELLIKDNGKNIRLATNFNGNGQSVVTVLELDRKNVPVAVAGQVRYTDPAGKPVNVTLNNLDVKVFVGKKEFKDVIEARKEQAKEPVNTSKSKLEGATGYVPSKKEKEEIQDKKDILNAANAIILSGKEVNAKNVSEHYKKTQGIELGDQYLTKLMNYLDADKNGAISLSDRRELSQNIKDMSSGLASNNLKAPITPTTGADGRPLNNKPKGPSYS